ELLSVAAAELDDRVDAVVGDEPVEGVRLEPRERPGGAVTRCAAACVALLPVHLGTGKCPPPYYAGGTRERGAEHWHAPQSLSVHDTITSRTELPSRACTTRGA